MALLGNLRRFDLKYNFQVVIVGVGSADFATCSEVMATVGEALLWQGGSILPVKEPTRMTFSDITLERGSSRDVDLYNWFKATSNAAANSGQESPLFKRQANIWQYQRDGSLAEFLDLHNAWPKEYSVGDFNNDADEFRIERIIFSYDYFERMPQEAN